MPTSLQSRPMDAQPLGYAGLLIHYGLDCPAPKRLTAVAAVGQKTTIRRDGVEWLLLPRSAKYRLPENPIDHLGIALKHEGVDLRVLNRLFKSGIEDELTEYISLNKRGLYTRKAWFFYEWMMGQQLDISPVEGVPYIPALDPTQYIVRRRNARSFRQKVDDNMPGLPGFCPLIRRTERLTDDRISALAAEARAAVAMADPLVLRRAVGFMLLNESKGSFGIEGETPPRNRLERWGRIIAEAKDIKLSIPEFESLHRSLFDPKQPFIAMGIRKKDGFVGRHDGRDQSPIPDHISARPEDLEELMSSLLATFEHLKRGRYDPIMIAAVIGFGFVFIHPFEDGNGRLHRFTIQKALVDTGFNPEGVVLPVSATILEDLPGYRGALEDYSSPTLEAIEWEPTPDHNVKVLNKTSHLYRYFDATRQAEYLLDRIERTVRFSLPAELDYINRFDQAKRGLGEVIDLPDRLASLFIQFCVQNSGRLSKNKREQHFQELSDERISAMEAAVSSSGIVALGVPPTVAA